MANSIKLLVGKEYKITHKTKGVFILKVEAQENDFVTGTITDGVAFRLAGPADKKGDVITIRVSQITLAQVVNRAA